MSFITRSAFERETGISVPELMSFIVIFWLLPFTLVNKIQIYNVAFVTPDKSAVLAVVPIQQI